MERAAEGVGSPITDALWLDTLHRICGRVSHELKGALNGVAVNLEVVRLRSGKPEAPASNVSKFANAAVDQLDSVITMTEAMLALARPIREPVELAPLVGRMDALLAPAARADGRRLVLDGAFSDLGVTTAPGNAACLAIGSCLLAATHASSDVRIRALLGHAEPAIRIESTDGATLAIDPEIVAAVAEAGIRIVAESSAFFISFPR